MVSIVSTELKPKQTKFKIKHPVTGETKFIVPDGDGGTKEVEGVLTLVGQYSDEYVNAAKYMAKQFEKVAKLSESEKMLDESKIMQSEMYASCIMDWDDNGFFSTKYSSEEAKDLLSQTENGWLVDQLAEFVQDKANFFFQRS